MTRIARLVVPGYPHHVTQRGNRRQQTFFIDSDYSAYMRFLSESCARSGTEIWAYCLMPNHVHLIAVPKLQDGLRGAIAEAHRRYTRMINLRYEWRGHLWQERFASSVMDEQHLLAAARYIELNPVRAGLVAGPQDYPYSSAAAHLAGSEDPLATVGPLLELVGNWQEFLSSTYTDEQKAELRRHQSSGRPLGDDGFIAKLETLTGRDLKPNKPGRPRKRPDK